MRCLYRDDYGPPDAQFDALAGGGMLLHGFEGQRDMLLGAQNLGQLEAMKRQLSRGEQIHWCDQGYGWVYGEPVNDLFAVVLFAVVVPWFVLRVVKLASRWGHIPSLIRLRAKRAI